MQTRSCNLTFSNTELGGDSNLKNFFTTTIIFFFFFFFNSLSFQDSFNRLFSILFSRPPFPVVLLWYQFTSFNRRYGVVDVECFCIFSRLSFVTKSLEHVNYQSALVICQRAEVTYSRESHLPLDHVMIICNQHMLKCIGHRFKRIGHRPKRFAYSPLN